jgi:hypothetical protein
MGNPNAGLTAEQAEALFNLKRKGLTPSGPENETAGNERECIGTR